MAAVGIGYLRGQPNLVRLPGSTPLLLVLSPLIGFGVALAVVFVSRLAVHRFDWARQLHRSFRALLGSLSGRDVLILALASSIGEELFFRGALQPWLGVWASAGVFALLHIGPGLRYLPWTLSAFAMGLVFGEMFNIVGDLIGPIVAHFTINYLNINYITRIELPGDPT
ncbi:MAG TPA: CPBP family intramembrane glutamic endopeptidase [Haliangiales bacterium]|nr:CPBP family intramembrane glutamic endopeptidase [Haliangiales bacterium]